MPGSLQNARKRNVREARPIEIATHTWKSKSPSSPSEDAVLPVSERTKAGTFSGYCHAVWNWEGASIEKAGRVRLDALMFVEVCNGDGGS